QRGHVVPEAEEPHSPREAEACSQRFELVAERTVADHHDIDVRQRRRHPRGGGEEGRVVLLWLETPDLSHQAPPGIESEAPPRRLAIEYERWHPGEIHAGVDDAPLGAAQSLPAHPPL